ncbi:MAG: NYN domain-containing protein [Clostridia bacterium]|nr:NYN domain-containing protein [Clostridia bacterium]
MASHFALFVDLENCGGKKSMLLDVIERVKIRGDILIGKVYGYTDSYSDLKETLLSNTFTVVPSLRYGRSQKNSMDIQLVIDALDVAYRNDLIDSFCIVSGDSDYVPLVGKLKSMGKFVLGISRSEAASGVFMNACSEFQFLESVTAGKDRPAAPVGEALSLADVNSMIVTILGESDSGEMLASEVKSILLRLRPDFSEKSVGHSTFGKLLARLSQQFGSFSLMSEGYNLILGLVQSHGGGGEALTRENYIPVFARILAEYRDDGFERVNPSLLKASVLSEYPDFSERQIGHRRFSDVLRALEREKLLRVVTDDSGNMLVNIL